MSRHCPWFAPGHRRTSLAAALALVLASLALTGCARGKTRSPEALRARYAEAVRRDDPDAAYKLLSPELQAQISREAFRKRWKAQGPERKQTLEAMRSLDSKTAVRSGQSLHDGDIVLRWVEVGDTFRIVDGLPGMPNMSTPATTIRALIAAIRSSDTNSLAALLGDDLTAQIREEWKRRADTLEELVARPGAIEYTPDMRRALLRYEPGRAVTLEQHPSGWKIISLK